MVKVGVIGLGMLGKAVALHLSDSGFGLTVYNRTEEKTHDLKERGVTIAKSPKEVAQSSELVITIVKDAKAVNEVSFGKNGIVEGTHEKLVVADMSTINPSESRKITEKFGEYNINKLDIPVMGGPNVAITGDLVMMASGNKQNFEECKNIFESIASKVFFLGESGVAHSVKLAMNLQITMLALALSEGITLVEKCRCRSKNFLRNSKLYIFQNWNERKKGIQND